MMAIVQGREVAAFVGQRCGADFAEPYTAIGFTLHGQHHGGAVFNNYNGRNVDLSVANDIRKWPPAFVRYFSDYVWNTLGVQRVTMIVRPGNERMCLKMGAQLEGMKRNWFEDGLDGIEFGLLKSEWKLER